MAVWGVCFYCRQKYQVYGPQLFCSKRCRKKYYQASSKFCPVCKKEFQPKGNQKFCCKEHRILYSKRKEAENDTEI